MSTVTRVSATSLYGRCDKCPGVVIRWKDRALHTANGLTHMLPEDLPPDPGLLPGWGLPVWRDEFNRDLSEWNVRNNDTAHNMLERRMAANCTVRDGQLVITARQEQIPGTTQLYTSGYVDTIGRVSLLVPGGLWVTRAQLPTAPTAGRGMWSALWARSDTGSGEIDVMEGYSDKPDLANAWECVVFTIHADTMVAGGNSKNYVHRFPAGQYPYLVPHEYGVELATDRLRFSIDGTVVWEPTVVAYPWLATMLTNTYNLRVNQQISAASDYFYAPDAGTQLPREMTVDYTRVYKKP